MSGGRRLPLLGRMDRYVTAHFVSSYATALLLVVGLFFILNMAANLDDYLEPWPNGETVPTSVLVGFYVLDLPYLFLQVAPFVTLVAGMFTVNRLLKKNEVVAGLSAGLSAHRILLPVFVGGTLAAVGMFGVREWLTGAIAPKRDAYRDILENQRYHRAYDDIWIRDLSGSYVALDEFHPAQGGEPDRVTGLQAVLRLPSDVMVGVSASSGVFVDGEWQLENGQRWVSGEERAVEQITSLEGFEFEPELAMTYMRKRLNPLELSFREVENLMSRDPDNVEYQTLWQYHLTFPLANLVLLLVGIPVMISHERGKGTDRMVVGGLLCIFYFAADFVFRNMGLEGGVSPVLASWLPILVFGSLGVVLYDAMKT